MPGRNFQVRTRPQDEDRKQNIYHLLDLYKAKHYPRIHSAFDALAEIVERAMPPEPEKISMDRPHAATDGHTAE